MKINKQLFEDVLSGKLKGTFVLRNGFMCSGNQLGRNDNWHAESCPYRIRYRVYKSNGVFGLFTVGDSWDIIDFIPDTNMKEVDFDFNLAKKILSNEIRGEITNNGNYPILILDINENEDYPLVTKVKGRDGWNVIKYNKKGVPQGWDGHKQTLHLKIKLQNMKENELTIEIPNGKIVDWDESKKQNKIVLKDKQLTYEDVCKKLSDKNSGHFYINGVGDIEHSYTNPGLINTASSEHQLECILAKNKFANVAKYLNDGWKPSGYIFGWFICACGEELEIRDRNDYKFNNNIIFKTKELAQQAIEILGEETVKLALEPLGI